MEYRTHKGITLSEIGIGLYALAGVYGKKDVNEFKRMLCRAVELGVNFFDTAEGYGDAECILGEVVNPYREDVCIATKVGVKEGTKPNLTQEYITKACEESLKQLQTAYIDVYHVHFDDPSTPVEETVEALETLVYEGKIRHYGVGHLPAEKVEAYCKTGNVFSVLMELSAVSRTARETVLPLCQKYNAGGIAFSTTGRGLLTGKFTAIPMFEPGDIRNLDPLFRRENFQSGLRIAQEVAELGKEYDKTPAQVALAWVLSQPGIICALSGPSTVLHLEENVNGSGWSLSSEHLNELEELFNKEDLWLKKEQIVSIQKILSHTLPLKFSDAFKDLVYVMETAVTLELVQEKEILPLFYQLFEMQKDEDIKGLQTIQDQLKDTIGSQPMHE